MIKGQHWDGAALADALVRSEEVASGRFALVLGKDNGANAPDDMIKVMLPECGDQEIFVGVHRPRILVSAIVCEASAVPSADRFNERLLRANKLLPLSAFALTTIEGKDYYEIYGELSTGSEIEEVIEEIETLGANAIEASKILEVWTASSAEGSN